MTPIASIAQVGLWRMGGLGLMPSQGRRPSTGFMKVPKMTAATATELTAVVAKMVR